MARFVAAAARSAGKPLVLLVAGDITRASAWVANQRGWRAWLGSLLARQVRAGELTLARQAVLVGAWGEELRAVFATRSRRVELCQDPNICDEHLTWRQDTCEQTTIRLLRVGRLLPTKGIEYLLDALAILRQHGRDAVLDIAGGVDDPAYSNNLEQRAERVGVRQFVTFHGTVPFGEPLFRLFRRADVHVISSLSEGIPRCVAEARAFCVPTVATAVGGLPNLIRDQQDGLLVPPANSTALAQAIERLIDDPVLRRQIIAKGFEIAKQSTAEYHAARLARLIQEALVDFAGGHAPL